MENVRQNLTGKDGPGCHQRQKEMAPPGEYMIVGTHLTVERGEEEEM